MDEDKDIDAFSREPLKPHEIQLLRRQLQQQSIRDGIERQRVKQKEAWRFSLTIIFPFLSTVAGMFVWLWGWLHGGKP